MARYMYKDSQATSYDNTGGVDTAIFKDVNACQYSKFHWKILLFSIACKREYRATLILKQTCSKLLAFCHLYEFSLFCQFLHPYEHLVLIWILLYSSLHQEKLKNLSAFTQKVHFSGLSLIVYYRALWNTYVRCMSLNPHLRTQRSCPPCILPTFGLFLF